MKREDEHERDVLGLYGKAEVPLKEVGDRLNLGLGPRFRLRRFLPFGYGVGEMENAVLCIFAKCLRERERQRELEKPRGKAKDLMIIKFGGAWDMLYVGAMFGARHFGI